jgi:flagellar protein FliS
MSSSSSNQHNGNASHAAQGSQTYLRNKVMTASPAELRLMLFDGAIRFAEQAKRGYEERNYEVAFDGTTKAQNILLELTTSLRHDQAPEICARLSSLYTFMYTSLVEASRERSAAKVEEVVKLLRFERETWQMCLQELVSETRSAAQVRELPRVNSTHMPSATGSPSGGTLSLQG